VIDPANSATERRDMTIIIQGARIVSVEPTAKVDIPSSAVVHDASTRVASTRWY
jgi:imidazolonepropionase-like amidohydrolase